MGTWTCGVISCHVHVCMSCLLLPPLLLFRYRKGSKAQAGVEKVYNQLKELLEKAGAQIRVGFVHGGNDVEVQAACENDDDYKRREATQRKADRAYFESVQEDFRIGKISVIVANDAFGMGIDHPSVRRVIVITPPQSIQRLYNQWGRAGRDGRHSLCTLYFRPHDFNEHEGAQPFSALLCPLSAVHPPSAPCMHSLCEPLCSDDSS